MAFGHDRHELLNQRYLTDLDVMILAGRLEAIAHRLRDLVTVDPETEGQPF